MSDEAPWFPNTLSLGALFYSILHARGNPLIKVSQQIARGLSARWCRAGAPQVGETGKEKGSVSQPEQGVKLMISLP